MQKLTIILLSMIITFGLSSCQNDEPNNREEREYMESIISDKAEKSDSRFLQFELSNPDIIQYVDSVYAVVSYQTNNKSKEFIVARTKIVQTEISFELPETIDSIYLISAQAIDTTKFLISDNSAFYNTIVFVAIKNGKKVGSFSLQNHFNDKNIKIGDVNYNITYANKILNINGIDSHIKKQNRSYIQFDTNVNSKLSKGWNTTVTEVTSVEGGKEDYDTYMVSQAEMHTAQSIASSARFYFIPN